MKYEKEFEMFLNQDKVQEYYYKINKINKIGNYYEIFVDNTEEIEEKYDIIIDRFYDYLIRNNINCEFEDVYNNCYEHISVYDTKEFCEN